MRRLLIAGNWKMNLKLDSAKALAQGLKDAAAGVAEVDIAVCPPSIYVQPVCEILNGSNIGVGAQNAYFEPAGAFTGELEMAMLTDVGCQYVILGHSERRHIMGESSEQVNLRSAALAAGLCPIVCTANCEKEREAGVTQRRQSPSTGRFFLQRYLNNESASLLTGSLGDRLARSLLPKKAKKVHADVRA